MNLAGRFKLARDRNITVANLVDELVQRKGDCEVSTDERGPFHLSELHAVVSSIDAFLRQSIELRPGQPVAIYRTNDRDCFHWFLAIIRAGGIAVPLNPQLSLAEVSRILADSGTEILVTDKAIFERNIVSRSALNVRVWIEVDDEKKRWMDLCGPATAVSFFRRPQSIRRRRLPSFTHPAPRGFPRALRFQAERCWARARQRF